MNILKSWTKNALFGWFGLQFQKTIVILQVSALEFVFLQSLAQKMKILKLRTFKAFEFV